MLQNAIVLVKTHLVLVRCNFFLSEGHFRRMSTVNLKTRKEPNIFNETLCCKERVARIQIKLEN